MGNKHVELEILLWLQGYDHVGMVGCISWLQYCNEVIQEGQAGRLEGGGCSLRERAAGLRRPLPGDRWKDDWYLIDWD